MKKIISILISTVLIFTLVFTATPALAAQKTSGKCGAKVSYSLNKKTGVLTVSGKGKMYNYNNNWNSNNHSPLEKLSKEIKKVNVKSGVTHIGAHAFSGCKSLKKVSLPESVKSFGASAFAGCSSLTKIKLPKKLKVIPVNCFGNCSKLKSINIPSKVKSIENYAFTNCYALSSLKLPKGLEHIRFYAFADCVKLKTVKIPKNCIAESSAFDCAKIEYAEFENGSKVIDNDVFYQCDLNTIYIPKSLKVIWISSLCGHPDIYYQGSKKDSEKIDILDYTEYEIGLPHYNNEYTSLKQLGNVYYNTSLSVKVPSVKKTTKGESSLKINVKKQKDIKGYELEYWKKTEYFGSKEPKSKTTKGTSFTLKNLTKGKKYCYRIRAYKKVNGKKVYSRFSKVKTVKV